ncbi:hypothetical protein ABIA22_001288 [Sinorhizobium fredii]
MSKNNASLLIRNQLLSTETCPFGAVDLVAGGGRREVMRGGNEAARAAGARAFPRSRPHPPVQGHARAHRSPFRQIGVRHPETGRFGLWRRDLLCRVGVGVRAFACPAVVLAGVRVGA